MDLGGKDGFASPQLRRDARGHRPGNGPGTPSERRRRAKLLRHGDIGRPGAGVVRAAAHAKRRVVPPPARPSTWLVPRRQSLTHSTRLRRTATCGQARAHIRRGRLPRTRSATRVPPRLDGRPPPDAGPAPAPRRTRPQGAPRAADRATPLPRWRRQGRPPARRSPRELESAERVQRAIPIPGPTTQGQRIPTALTTPRRTGPQARRAQRTALRRCRVGGARNGLLRGGVRVSLSRQSEFSGPFRFRGRPRRGTGSRPRSPPRDGPGRRRAARGAADRATPLPRWRRQERPPARRSPRELESAERVRATPGPRWSPRGRRGRGGR